MNGTASSRESTRKKQDLLWRQAKEKHELLERTYREHYSPASRAVVALETAKATLTKVFAPQLVFGARLGSGVRNITKTIGGVILAYHTRPKAFPRTTSRVIGRLQHVVRELHAGGLESFHAILQRQYTGAAEKASLMRDRLSDKTTSNEGLALNGAMISPVFQMNIKLLRAQQAKREQTQPFVRKLKAVCSADGILRMGTAAFATSDMEPLIKALNASRRRLLADESYSARHLATPTITTQLVFIAGCACGAVLALALWSS